MRGNPSLRLDPPRCSLRFGKGKYLHWHLSRSRCVCVGTSAETDATVLSRRMFVRKHPFRSSESQESERASWNLHRCPGTLWIKFDSQKERFKWWRDAFLKIGRSELRDWNKIFDSLSCLLETLEGMWREETEIRDSDSNDNDSTLSPQSKNGRQSNPDNWQRHSRDSLNVSNCNLGDLYLESASTWRSAFRRGPNPSELNRRDTHIARHYWNELPEILCSSTWERRVRRDNKKSSA